MNKRFDNLGSLGDLLPETELRCRIRGCKNVFPVSGEQVLHNLAKGHKGKSEKMCDSCYQRFLELTDQELPCSGADCTNTWTWNRYQQLENFAAGFADAPPRGLCANCRQDMREGEDVEQKCRIRSCTNTWVWTKRMQIQSRDSKPPRRFCEECFQTLNTLKDVELPCRMKDCKNTFIWNRHQQLAHIRDGKSLEDAPKKMCQSCFEIFRTFKSREETCKINGCSSTWTYNAYEQLENILNNPGVESPAVPQKMCKECYSFYNSAVDIEAPCRNRGCEKTWLWTRSMQLNAKVKKRNLNPPQRMCQDCSEELKILNDIEMPCSEEGCKNTWSYKGIDQLKDKLLNRKPAAKICQTCQEFLASNPAQEISCSRCAKVSFWSSHEQLRCMLGVFDKPALCADCVKSEITAMRPVEEKVPFEEKFRVIIPSGGPWNESNIIRDWPRHMDRESIIAIQESPIRVVCIGDELTFCNDDSEKSWPAMLEKRLQKRFTEEIGKISIMNSGISACTTKLASLRIQRDVVPFQPQLLIFSFAFADTNLKENQFQDKEFLNEYMQKLLENLNAFCKEIKDTLPETKLLAWLPNPIYPQDVSFNNPDWRESGKINEAAKNFYEAYLRQMKNFCNNEKIAVLDIRSLFELGGQKSAMRWMENWYMPNESGFNNFVGWFENIIANEKLLESGIRE